MWIMISGPYRHASKNKAEWQDRLDAMNRAAFKVHRLGHVPVIGVNMALPIIQATGEEHYKEVMMPVSMELAKRCDAVLRIGGESKGADQEVEWFVKNKLPVYYSIDEID